VDTVTERRKLIEVALPLEAINKALKMEKDRKVGKPQQVHHWWARRPITSARAVLFAQLVDDPASRPEAAEIPNDEDREVWIGRERVRLYRLLEKLVAWESATDERVLEEARAEILRSTGGDPPPILDPFAGGGSIPLEAQRLGLRVHASDLNPVAVLINKALIEIPPRFADMPPLFPGAAESRIGGWSKSAGLAEDTRLYGAWLLEEVQRRIGHLYPKVVLPDGSKASVIAWIWARTVTCPNPACGIQMPLVRSWWLGKKKGKEAYIVPRVADGTVHFAISNDVLKGPLKEADGTVGRTGGKCIGCESGVDLNYTRAEGRSGRLGAQLIATVAEGHRRRLYLPPDDEQIEAARIVAPDNAPPGELFDWPGRINVVRYGLTGCPKITTADVSGCT